jgi:hypothetical protein
MLQAQDLDILAVQEVRFEAGDHTHNQIGELARFLPDYQVTPQSVSLPLWLIIAERLLLAMYHPSLLRSPANLLSLNGHL